jgi:murein DD-endopeptidase MepM/ murein hydrolase activator NlpD
MPRIWVSSFLLLILTACTVGAGTPTVLAPAVPYQTVTSLMTPTVLPPLVEILLPTPTTFTYTVVQGDTLIGIAGRYGVTLEALVAANPSIQPATLAVGAILTIPIGNQASGEPTPTPALSPVLQAHCWPETGGGLWCFALVQNPYAETLENLSAQFTLLDSDQQPLSNQEAFGLLDILPPGRNMPLAVHFPPPVNADAQVRVQVLTATRLLPGDTRYLPVTLGDTLVSVAASGQTAQVSGRVALTGPGTAGNLWILATAYDAIGDVVAVRRWDSPSTLTVDEPVSFNFLVSSLGPRIERVEFLAEAKP